ncbi:putative LPS assembly protein LptD [Parasediminibacterium sp. JCM 36343]|uniref:putative LPS assembly protein LptD n=1 Tax=Parasediminibacterium sp. JCM 36343 TaxID=3374279 RepID=UPI00397C1D4B
MDKRSKIKVNKNGAFVAAVCLFIFVVQLTARGIHKRPLLSDKYIALTDTVPAKAKDKKGKQTKLPAGGDTAKLNKPDSTQRIDTLTISRDSIDAPISYEASDSGVLIIPTKDFILYGKAKVKNKDVALDAATIKYQQATQLVQAYGAKDTTGNPYSKPNLTQGETKTISDSILFSLKTLKGVTKNTYVQDGEMYVNANTLKKVNGSDYYGYRARFTTCNLDTPHFAFRARRIKLVTNKLAVTGPTTPEIEGVPLPVGIPFGIFPLAQGRHSGVLAPAFATSEDYGLGLEGLGYYQVFSDYLDVTTRSNLYSYGGWSLNVAPKYQRRYRYAGGLSVTLQKTKSLNRATYGYLTPEEFNSTSSYMINWNHSQDPRVRPGTNLSANVNFGSTRYNSTILNNPYANFQNQLSSNVNYSKDFRGKGNVSLNFNHSQNSVTHLVNVILPTVTGSIVTFYPLQKKEAVGTPKWYEKLGIGYSGNFTNQVAFYDTAFKFKQVLDTLQWGATHSIPISIALPQLGPVTISPGVSLEQKWYGQSFTRRWNGKSIDTIIQKGFYTGTQTSFGISANTRLFGTYGFGKKSNIVAIRHEVRPSVSFNYTPDLASGTHYTTQVDTFGHQLRFSKFDGVIPGAYSEGNSGSISFGIDNLLEMKVKDKKDSTKTDATKKVKLIDGFGFNSSYNLLADSFALAPFQFYARSTLFSVVNISGSLSMDPYSVDKYGYRQKTYSLATNGKLGRITNGNIALSTSFKSKPKDGKTDKDRMPNDPFMTPEEQQQQLQYARSNPAEYTDFNIPWSLSLSYSLNYTKQLQANYIYANLITSSINFNGDFSLTEKWKAGGTGYYDFNAGRLQQLSMFITREMHCWQMAINVNPIGLYRSFNITISPKAGILRDLRINRNRTFSNY